MDTPLPDPTQITSWPSALVTVVLLILVLGLPSVLTYLGNRQTRAVARTLDERNGGSSVRDSLDRIEAAQHATGRHLTVLADRVTVLETATTAAAAEGER